MVPVIYIYKIESTTDNKDHVYIGSSINVKRRFADHKVRFLKKSTNTTVSHKVFTAYGIDNTQLTVIEECTPNNRVEREAYYINTIPCVNIMHPGRTQKQYYEANKQHIIEQHNAYQKTPVSKKWQSTVHQCECGHHYTNSHKSRHIKKYHTIV